MGWALGKWKWSCSVVSDSLRPHAHGILQARILEWVAVSFSRGSSQHRDWTLVSHTAGRLITVWARALGRYFQVHVVIFMYFCESHLCTCPECRGDHSLPCPPKASCMLNCGVTEHHIYLYTFPCHFHCPQIMSLFFWGIIDIQYSVNLDFSGGSVVKNLPANAGDTDSIPGLGISSGEGNGNPVQKYCLEDPMDRGS